MDLLESLLLLLDLSVPVLLLLALHTLLLSKSLVDLGTSPLKSLQLSLVLLADLPWRHLVSGRPHVHL